MRIVRCSWFPPSGFQSIALVWWIIVRSDIELYDELINHEAIHCKQQKEMLVLPFLLWYCIEFIIRWIMHPRYPRKAYRRISFEREAYINEKNLSYLSNRKSYSWVKYIN